MDNFLYFNDPFPHLIKQSNISSSILHIKSALLWYMSTLRGYVVIYSLGTDIVDILL